MTDEQRKDETEVEGHSSRVGTNEEPPEEGDESEVEAHVHRVANVRMDSPSNT